MASEGVEIAKAQEERKKMEQQLASLTSVTFDTDLYGNGNQKNEYLSSIPTTEEDEHPDPMDSQVARKLAAWYTAPRSVMNEVPRAGEDDDMGFKKPQRIIDREDAYRRKRLNRVISPDRHDAFVDVDKTPDPSVRTFADVMREQALNREKEETLRAIAKKKKEEENKEKDREAGGAQLAQNSQKRRNTWDQSQDDGNAKKGKTAPSDWDMPDSTPGIGRWDATPIPGRVGDATPSIILEEPVG